MRRVLRRVLLVTAWVAGLSLGISCAQDGGLLSSSASTSAQSSQGQTAPSARLVGDVTFSACGAGGCTFQGTVHNDGPSCANVRGVTRLLDQSGMELASQSWIVNGRMRPGDEDQFTGCCFPAAAVNGHATQRTEVTASPIQCI
jgi:hypothetical protein